MNYEEMSDFEINKAVAEARGGFGGSTNNEYTPNEVKCFDCKPFTTERDYCGDASDTWPIITDNKITIQPPHVSDGIWHCYDMDYELFGKDKNPLRAACIVYLMMQEAK